MKERVDLEAQALEILSELGRLVPIDELDLAAFDSHDVSHFTDDKFDDEREVIEVLLKMNDLFEQWGHSSLSIWEAISTHASISANNRSEATKSNIGPPKSKQRALLTMLLKCMLKSSESGDGVSKENGPKSGSLAKSPILCAWIASKTYLSLLLLPGSIAHGVFHETIFGQVLSCLRQWCNSYVPQKPKLTDSSSATQQREQNRITSKRRIRERDSNASSISGVSTSFGTLDESEESNYIQIVLNIVQLIQAMVKTSLIPFTLHTDILQKLGEVLVGIAVIATLVGSESNQLKSSAVDAMSFLAIFGVEIPLNDIAKQEENDIFSPGGPASVLFQSFLPILLMQSGKKDVPNVPRERLKAHDMAVSAVIQIINKMQEAEDAIGVNRNVEGSIELNTALRCSLGSISVHTQEPLPFKFSPIVALIQHLCVRNSDRAETRCKIAAAIVKILGILKSNVHLTKCINFIGRSSRSSKPTLRGFAVELAALLVGENWIWDNDEGQLFVKIVISRCTDKVPTVRSKAGSSLCSMIERVTSEQEKGCNARLRDEIVANVGWKTQGHQSVEVDLNSSGLLLKVLRTMLIDERANVRKNAIQASQSLLLLLINSQGLTAAAIEDKILTDIWLIRDRCNDVSLSCRKAAITAVTNLTIALPTMESLQDICVDALLPLASDPEQTCQVKLAESLCNLVLDRILEWHDCVTKTASGGHISTLENMWSVWPLLAKMTLGNHARCLKKCIGVLVKGKGASSKENVYKVAPILEALRIAAIIALPEPTTPSKNSEKVGISKEEMYLAGVREDLSANMLIQVRKGCWTLLEAFLVEGISKNASHLTTGKSFDPMFVVKCWDRIREHMSVDSTDLKNTEEEGRRVLEVMERLASCFPKNVLLSLSTQLKSMLVKLSCGPDISTAAIFTLTGLTCALCKDKDYSISLICRDWVNDILAQCVSVLDSFVRHGTSALSNHESYSKVASGNRVSGAVVLLERALHFAGDAVMVGFDIEEKSEDDKGNNHIKNSSAVISSRLVELVQVLLPPFLPSLNNSGTVNDSYVKSIAVPPTVRALAFVTLGKLCLCDYTLAKNSVTMLVREMASENTPPAVRSNAVIVLGDLCVRYTALVERHVPAMAARLQDPYPMVRRHTLLLLCRLLLQDYLKCKGLILFRLFACLADPDPHVAQLAQSTLTNAMLAKYPGLFAQNFVEAVIILNGFSEHPIYAVTDGVDDKGLSGMNANIDLEEISLSKDNRIKVYNVLLQSLTDEQKITVTAKLAHEILGSAVDGGIPLLKSHGISDATLEKAESVCRDAFHILAGSGLKIGTKTGTNDEADDDDMPQTSESEKQNLSTGIHSAKTRLLSTMSRRHLMENVVPIVVSLKHILEAKHSPLLRELMGYFRELLKNYKDEVKEVLASDPTLSSEIEYDMKKFDMEEMEMRKKQILHAKNSLNQIKNNTSTYNSTPTRTRIASIGQNKVDAVLQINMSADRLVTSVLRIQHTAAKSKSNRKENGPMSLIKSTPPPKLKFTGTKGDCLSLNRTPSQAVALALGAGKGSTLLGTPIPRISKTSDGIVVDSPLYVIIQNPNNKELLLSRRKNKQSENVSPDLKRKTALKSKDSMQPTRSRKRSK